jgi:REP element-mobilizing transposase RayT
MTNHIHLLMTWVERRSVSDALQATGRRFVPYINHSCGGTGTLWEGRFKAKSVQEDADLLTCCAASSSIRFVPGWPMTRSTTVGRAVAPTP